MGLFRVPVPYEGELRAPSILHQKMSLGPSAHFCSVCSMSLAMQFDRQQFLLPCTYTSDCTVMQVIHMDLKSKHVLLNRDQTVAKIADVGLSRGFNSANTDFVAGTLEYSALEVLLGRPCTLKVNNYK